MIRLIVNESIRSGHVFEWILPGTPADIDLADEVRAVLVCSAAPVGAVGRTLSLRVIAGTVLGKGPAHAIRLSEVDFVISQVRGPRGLISFSPVRSRTRPDPGLAFYVCAEVSAHCVIWGIHRGTFIDAPILDRAAEEIYVNRHFGGS